MIAREVKRREVCELCDRLGYLGDLIAIEVKRREVCELCDRLGYLGDLIDREVKLGEVDGAVRSPRVSR